MSGNLQRRWKPNRQAENATGTYTTRALWARTDTGCDVMNPGRGLWNRSLPSELEIKPGSLQCHPPQLLPGRYLSWSYW